MLTVLLLHQIPDVVSWHGVPHVFAQLLHVPPQLGVHVTEEIRVSLICVQYCIVNMQTASTVTEAGFSKPPEPLLCKSRVNSSYCPIFVLLSTIIVIIRYFVDATDCNFFEEDSIS